MSYSAAFFFGVSSALIKAAHSLKIREEASLGRLEQLELQEMKGDLVVIAKSYSQRQGVNKLDMYLSV